MRVASATGKPPGICFPFVGSTLGGSHISALLLARSLRPRYRPIIVVHEDGPLTAHLSRQGIEYRLLPLPEYVGSGRTITAHARAVLRTLFRLARFLRREEIHLVHANDGKTGQTWGLPTRLARVPFVWHQRSVYVPSRLTRLLLKTADRVVCISRFTASRLPPECRPRSCVVDNPFDTDARPPRRGASRRRLTGELGCDPETRIVGFFGNFMERKRPLGFVDVVAALHDLDPTLPFVGVMFGEARNGLGDAVTAHARRLGVGHRVFRMGFRYPPEPYIAGCDLLVATAVHEPFGRTVVESMSVGTPVVAARSGAHEEILIDGETGLLVPRDDPQAFAEAARRLLKDAEFWAVISRNARTHAHKRYPLQIHVEQMCGIYDELLGARRR